MNTYKINTFVFGQMKKMMDGGILWKKFDQQNVLVKPTVKTIEEWLSKLVEEGIPENGKENNKTMISVHNG